MGASRSIAQPASKSAASACPELSSSALACLHKLAARYVWWKTPEEATQYPQRVAAQVMNLGAWDDWVTMWKAVGDDYLRWALENAEAGQLDERSWHYWHYRLGLAEYPNRPVPPMPVMAGRVLRCDHSKLSDLRCYVEQFVHNPAPVVLADLRLDNESDARVIKALASKDADIGSRSQEVVSWLNAYSAWQSFPLESRRAIAAQVIGYYDRLPVIRSLDSVEGIISEFQCLERQIQPLAPRSKSGSPRHVTSLTSKVLWCCYPDDVPMLDSYASTGLQVLAHLSNLTTTRSQLRYAEFVEIWFQLLDELADIVNHAQESRPDLWPFRSRVLDKVLMGSRPARIRGSCRLGLLFPLAAILTPYSAILPRCR